MEIWFRTTPPTPSSFKFKLCVPYVSGVERSACTRESPDLAQPCPASAGLMLGHSLPSAVCGAQGAGKSASKTGLLNRSGRGLKAWISSSGGGGIPPTPVPGDPGAFPEPSPSGLQQDGGCGMLWAASCCHPPAGCPSRAAKSSVLEQCPASPSCTLQGGRRQPAGGDTGSGPPALQAAGGDSVPLPAGRAGAGLEAEGRSCGGEAALAEAALPWKSESAPSPPSPWDPGCCPQRGCVTPWHPPPTAG